MGTFSGPITRRSCFALSLRKTPCISKVWIGFLLVLLLHELNQRASEEKGSFLFSIPVVLLGSPKVVGRADSLGQEQAFWTNL